MSKKAIVNNIFTTPIKSRVSAESSVCRSIKKNWTITGIKKSVAERYTLLLW